MESKSLTTQFEIASLDELTEVQSSLISQAKIASTKAYAPYSKFHVGAALKAKSGIVATGNNQENSSFPASVCAERVALLHFKSQEREDAITHLAVYVKPEGFEITEPVSPCGICRQVLLETEQRQESPIQILLATVQNDVVIIPSAQSLLPLSFYEKRLRK